MLFRKQGMEASSSNGRYISSNKALPYPLSEIPYSSYTLERRGIPFSFWRTESQAPFSLSLYCLRWTLQAGGSSIHAPWTARIPTGSRCIYPSALMGAHAYSAGIYSMKHFPRTLPFKNTIPSSSLSFSQFFLDMTWISLLLEIAQLMCSLSIFSCVSFTSSILYCLRIVQPAFT